MRRRSFQTSSVHHDIAIGLSWRCATAASRAAKAGGQLRSVLHTAQLDASALLRSMRSKHRQAMSGAAKYPDCRGDRRRPQGSGPQESSKRVLPMLPCSTRAYLASWPLFFWQSEVLMKVGASVWMGDAAGTEGDDWQSACKPR